MRGRQEIAPVKFHGAQENILFVRETITFTVEPL